MELLGIEPQTFQIRCTSLINRPHHLTYHTNLDFQDRNPNQDHYRFSKIEIVRSDQDPKILQ